MEGERARSTHLLNLAAFRYLGGAVQSVVDRTPRREVTEVMEDVEVLSVEAVAMRGKEGEAEGSRSEKLASSKEKEGDERQSVGKSSKNG